MLFVKIRFDNCIVRTSFFPRQKINAGKKEKYAVYRRSGDAKGEKPLGDQHRPVRLPDEHPRRQPGKNDIKERYRPQYHQKYQSCFAQFHCRRPP